MKHLVQAQKGTFLCIGIAMFLEVRGLLLRATKVGSKHSNCSNSQTKCRLRSMENKLASETSKQLLFTSVRFKWDIEQIKIIRSSWFIVESSSYYCYSVLISKYLLKIFEKFLKLTTISSNFTILQHIFHYHIFIS